MPTNKVTPLRIMRAAAMVIISSDVYVVSGTTGRPFQTSFVLGEILGAQHVPIDPRFKRVPIPGDHVPGLVKSVVALIITLRVRRERPALHLAHRAQHPGWKYHRVRRR